MNKTLLSLMALGACCGLASAADPQKAAVDNTAKNARDASEHKVTPQDQSNQAHDVDLARTIRQAVVGDRSLSMNAKNVKIITSNGRVTLRGPVKNAEERAKIEATAVRTAGAGKVTNEIEIKESK